MRNLFVLLTVVALVFAPMASFAEVDLVIGLNPLSFLVSPDAEDFSAAQCNGFSCRRERVDGNTSWIPSATIGIGIDTDPAFFDFTVGGGYAYGGDVYKATFALADVAALFKLHGSSKKGVIGGKGPLITLGPHASIIYFDADWKGDVGVEFDPTVGYMIGPRFTIGNKTMSFSASLDYVHLPVEVDQQSNVYTSDDEFDLSGIALQLGILFRF